MTCYLTRTCVCVRLCVIYKGCNQRCHNVSVPAGEVPHCLSGDATSHRVKHTHTHANTAGQVGVFLPMSHGEKEEIVEAHSMRGLNQIALCLYTVCLHQSSMHLFIKSVYSYASKYVCMWYLIYVCHVAVCVCIFRPNRRETITSSMRCWQVFLLTRSAHCICRKLRLTTI